MRRFWFGKDRLEQMNHIVMNHYTIIMSVAIAFSISVVLGPVIIPFLKRLKVGQTERDDGERGRRKVAPEEGGYAYDGRDIDSHRCSRDFRGLYERLP